MTQRDLFPPWLDEPGVSRWWQLAAIIVFVAEGVGFFVLFSVVLP